MCIKNAIQWQKFTSNPVTIQLLSSMWKKSTFEDIAVKGKNAGYQILYFPALPFVFKPTKDQSSMYYSNPLPHNLPKV